MFSQRVPALYKWETLAINIIPTSYLSLVCVGSSHTVIQRDRGRDDGIEVTPKCKNRGIYRLTACCLATEFAVASILWSAHLNASRRSITTWEHVDYDAYSQQEEKRYDDHRSTFYGLWFIVTTCSSTSYAWQRSLPGINFCEVPDSVPCTPW